MREKQYSYLYYIPTTGQTLADAYPMKSDFQEMSIVVEEMALDYWHNYSGYEQAWPLQFVICDEDGKYCYGTYEVEVEFEPTFYPREVQNVTA